MTRTPDPDVTRRLTDPARMQHLVAELYAERRRAHAKHGDQSVEVASSPFDRRLLPILVEEVGEVARELNDVAGLSPADAATTITMTRLRGELVQAGAMVLAWIDHVDLAGVDKLLRDPDAPSTRTAAAHG